MNDDSKTTVGRLITAPEARAMTCQELDACRDEDLGTHARQLKYVIRHTFCGLEVRPRTAEEWDELRDKPVSYVAGGA